MNTKFKLREGSKILGIYFSNYIPALEIDDNWLPRIENIERAIVTWSKRNCSIMGKICIVKSLLLPQIIFAMQALVAPADIIKKLNTLFFRFIWKKKTLQYQLGFWKGKKENYVLKNGRTRFKHD